MLATYLEHESYFVRMARAIAGRNHRYDLAEDLAQEARMAWWLFLQSYDPARNDNAGKAAYLRVRGAVLDALRRQHDIARRGSRDRHYERVAEIVPLNEAITVAAPTKTWGEAFPMHWDAIVTPREEMILRLRFREGLSPREVGKQMHISPARVVHIQTRGVERLKHVCC